MKQIIDALSCLKGSKLKEIGRAANMVWCWFVNGSKEYNLHIQCSCRFTNGDNIIIANGDIYVPSTNFEGEYTDFDFDVIGNTLYDELHSSFINENDFIVKDINVSVFNDLKVVFENDFILSTYSNNSGESEEQWRFFLENENSKHLVVYPKTFSL